MEQYYSLNNYDVELFTCLIGRNLRNHFHESRLRSLLDVSPCDIGRTFWGKIREIRGPTICTGVINRLSYSSSRSCLAGVCLTN